MFESTILMTYLAAVIAIVLAPGPGQALVITQTIGSGRTMGLLTSLGLNVGTLVHTLAAALGLSAILASSALAFSIVKYLGAAYLIYLGIKALLDRKPSMMPDTRVDTVLHYRQGFVHAILIGILNPKVALFFLAFLPQFVQPERGAVLLQFMILGLLLALVGILWDCVLISAVSKIGARLARSPKIAVWRQRITGMVLVGLGVQLALTQHE